MTKPNTLDAARGQCASCAHWEGNPDGSAGFCLRFPPVVVADDEGVSTVWPITEATERCGEHRANQ